MRGIQFEKEEINLPLFTDNMIVHVENPKESTLMKLMNNYNEFSGYKVNK